jgi:regulator of protease activity HflC (stomatin/prohibitin superfamily)
MTNVTNDTNVTERELKALPGMPLLILWIILYLGSFGLIIWSGNLLDAGTNTAFGAFLLVVGIVYLCLGWIPFMGLKVLKPQESLVLTLFGNYVGTLKGAGFYQVNPFCVAVNPTVGAGMATATEDQNPMGALNKTTASTTAKPTPSRIVSLKAMTLNNNKQKVNDMLGNPIEIGVVVIWRVVDTAKAVFNVENYKAFLSIQCDTALRNVARMFPYDHVDDDESSLRGSSQEVADKLKSELQSRVTIAGLEVIEARITHLAYSPEIAAVMLQRQQAAAIIDARKMIVDGAVDIVEMALDKLSVNNIANLDDERRAAMVSNLLVVLCSNRDAQPVVNSGSIY